VLWSSLCGANAVQRPASDDGNVATPKKQKVAAGAPRAIPDWCRSCARLIGNKGKNRDHQCFNQAGA